MEIGIFANESDDNFLGSRDLDNDYESDYLVRFESEKVSLHLERPLAELNIILGLGNLLVVVLQI